MRTLNIEHLLKAREARSTRKTRPFRTFYDAVSPCLVACEGLLSGSAPKEFVPLLSRSVVITTVTSVEVYFRDILEAIFKYCEPTYIESKLKHLHAEKYDIEDLVEVYKHRIHPLELVVGSQSFQNIDRIEKVFSKFVERSLWAAVRNLKVRLPSAPENVATWNEEEVGALDRTFELRHELVHNPRDNFRISQKVMDDLYEVEYLIFGADVVITSAMQEHRDPALDEELNQH